MSQLLALVAPRAGFDVTDRRVWPAVRSSSEAAVRASLLKCSPVLHVVPLHAGAIHAEAFPRRLSFHFALSFSFGLAFSFPLSKPSVRSLPEHVAQQLSTVTQGFILIHHLRHRVIQADVHFTMVLPVLVVDLVILVVGLVALIILVVGGLAHVVGLAILVAPVIRMSRKVLPIRVASVIRGIVNPVPEDLSNGALNLLELYASISKHPDALLLVGCKAAKAALS